MRSTRPKPRPKLWVDIGRDEGRRAVDDARLLKAALVGAGWVVGEDLYYGEHEEADHSEAAWAERVGPMLRWLFPVG